MDAGALTEGKVGGGFVGAALAGVAFGKATRRDRCTYHGGLTIAVALCRSGSPSVPKAVQPPPI
ncbi:MAG: hypothetical protein MO852_07655 [Candidatus Devosia euplotis]|nr:hypothetical protein [Candidatus Devosia euplotis]